MDSGVAREERKIVTVLFADLVGFTSRAEQLDPEDVRAMLSPYYARLRSELERRGGTVEKFIGDAAAEIYDEAGSLPDAAFARLRAAEALIVDGRRVEGDPELQRALAFYRSVDATACIREGEALLARTA